MKKFTNMTGKIGSYLLYCTLLLLLFLGSGCSREAKKSRYLAQGAREFDSGAYERAKIDYMKVLQLDQRNATAYARIGQMWLEEGAPLRAGAFLKKAAELAPTDSDNRIRLARLYFAIGQSEKAKSEVSAALQQSPPNGNALVLLTEISQTPEEISAAEQALQKFPEKQTARYLIATANVALRKKDLAAAEKAINQAVALDPKYPESHQAMGILHLLRNNRKEAIGQFKVAAELAPLRSPLRLAYADFQRQTESVDAATAYLKDLTTKAPDFLPAWTLLARMAFGEKKYDEALRLLENVYSRDPLNIDARLLQSDVWIVRKEPTKAIAEMEKLDHAFPGLPSVKYRLAQAYLQQDKAPQAAVALDEAVAKNPNYTEAVLARAKLNLRTGHPQPAADALEALLKKHPALEPAQLLLADAYRALGRLDDAAAIFRQQIQAKPQVPNPYFFLGVVQAQQNKPEEARKSFEKVLELAPDNPLAIDQLVDLDVKAKDFAAASQRIEEQLKKHPKAAASYLLLGKVQMAQEKWKEAEATLKKALEIDSNSAAACDMLVKTYLATNRLPEAAREVERVLEKAPKNQSALMTLAAIRGQQKDFAKARDAYERVLAINPNFVSVLNNLAYLYAEHLNQPDKAYDLAQKARTLDPGNAAVADTLGWAAFKRGDYQQALTLLKEGASNLTANPEVQYHLGMAHYMMGQAEAARTAFQKAVEGTEDFPGKAEAKSRLALLKEGSDGDSSMTIEQLRQLLQKQPNDLVARLRLAQAYEGTKDWTKAADAYEAALKINPKIASATLKLAQIYGGPLQNKEKALSYAKTARSLSPNDPEATAVLGRIAFENGDFSWSYSLLQETSRQINSDPRVWHDLAWASYSLGKVDPAREAMERCLKISPDPEMAADAKSFLSLTDAQENATSLASKKSEIDQALKVNPTYTPALMAAAALDLRAGDRAAAVSRYQQVLARFPDFVPAQKNLAQLYAEDPAHATDAFDLATKARKALPADPEVARLLGQLNYQKKDYPRAIQLLQESARQQPLDATGLYYLGSSQIAADQKPAGRQSLEKALAAGLKDPLEKDAKRALASLGRP
jgi:tetratricopeptide (TPR) repeat protein